MTEKKEKLLSLLHKAFELEYNDTFSYLNEAQLFEFKTVDGERVGGIFRKFNEFEQIHADKLSAKIIELGGKAQWNFKQFEPETSLRKALEKHIGAEADAYRVYTQLIESCEDKGFVLLLKGIREEEKDHLEKVKHILKKLESK